MSFRIWTVGIIVVTALGKIGRTTAALAKHFAEEDGVASTAFEVTVKVLMRADGLQINQPHPIIETVPKQI